MEFIDSAGMKGLKRSFANAIEPANFIIKFRIDEDDGFVPFELTNILTGERMTLRQMDEYYWLLVRCPIVREEDKWAKHGSGDVINGIASSLTSVTATSATRWLRQRQDACV
uniref:SH2 domain-containing protein n=1 Tax=Globodera pallida TaxID=36090 RepID=A0A183C2I6_GLOPA